MEGENITEKTFEFPFEKLEVWHLAVDLADFILGLLESFPQKKSQTRRANGGSSNKHRSEYR